MSKYVVRDEAEQDINSVRTLNIAAFEGTEEADIIDKLRASSDPIIGLVAEQDGRTIGCIYASPIKFKADGAAKFLGLGPMAVSPEAQGQGVGSALVKACLEKCVEAGADAVFVVGHAEYYPRFGFRPASPLGFTTQWDLPEDVFMVLPLTPEFDFPRGLVQFHRAFSEEEQ